MNKLVYLILLIISIQLCQLTAAEEECVKSKIIKEYLKIGKLDHDNRCDVSGKYAISYMNDFQELAVYVPARYNNKTTFKQEVSIGGDLFVEGKIFNDDVNRKLCMLLPIENTECAYDNCTNVVLCNQTKCSTEKIYSVKNNDCISSPCKVDCDSGDIPFGIHCSSHYGYNGVYSDGYTAICTSNATIDMVETSCWKRGTYLTRYRVSRRLYKVTNKCNSDHCIATCTYEDDIPMGIECTTVHEKIKEIINDGSSVHCLSSDRDSITVSAVCMSGYHKNCLGTLNSVAEPSIKSAYSNGNYCKTTCPSGTYASVTMCGAVSSKTAYIKGVVKTDNTITCITGGDVESCMVQAYCWENEGEIALEG